MMPIFLFVLKEIQPAFVRIYRFQIFFKSFTSVINTKTQTMADVSLDDLIKQDREKHKAQRTNTVHALLSRKPSKRKSFTNKEIRMSLSQTLTNLTSSPTSLTSKISTTTNPNFRAKNFNMLRTLKGPTNSNKISQEKNLKMKRLSRKISSSEP